MTDTSGGAGGTPGEEGAILAGRYRILRKLGEGAMGAVYLGEHLRMGRKDAIKVVSRAMAGSAEALARFEREARNASFINHPHVCQIYDFGETEDGLAFLAMEFVEGQTLTDVLEAEGGRLPVDRAIRIALQTADALEAAHARAIVHRDLKPDNIMLTRGRDGGDMVKVVDFGIAKGIGDDEGQAVTRLGFVIGTPEYMSPEQLSGDRLDGRSDVYSLALVLVRLLTGTFPFSATTAQELMLKRLTEDPRPLGDLAPDRVFPGGLQGVLDRALARSAGDRYPSASAFRQELQAVLGGVGGTSHAGPVPDTRVEPRSGEGRGPGVPPPGLPPVPPPTPGREPAAAGGGSPGAARPPRWILGAGAVAVVAVVAVVWALGSGDGEAAGDPTGGDVVAVQDPPDLDPDPPVVDPEEGEEPGGPVGGGGTGSTDAPPATGGGGPVVVDRPPDVDPPPADPPPARSAIAVDAGTAPALVTRQDDLFYLEVMASGTLTPSAVQDSVQAGGPNGARMARVMAAVRDTLEAVVETTSVPDRVRGIAAYQLGFLTGFTPGTSLDEQVAWYRRAVALDPTNEEYRSVLANLAGRR